MRGRAKVRACSTALVFHNTSCHTWMSWHVEWPALSWLVGADQFHSATCTWYIRCECWYMRGCCREIQQAHVLTEFLPQVPLSATRGTRVHASFLPLSLFLSPFLSLSPVHAADELPLSTKPERRPCVYHLPFEPGGALYPNGKQVVKYNCLLYKGARNCMSLCPASCQHATSFPGTSHITSCMLTTVLGRIRTTLSNR